MIVGTGVDVVEIARFERAWTRRGAGFLRRVFTALETRDCLGRPGAARALALRFAAKEAAMKALGTGWGQGVRWTEIECAAAPGPDRLRAFPNAWSLAWAGRAGEHFEGLGGASRPVAHLAASCHGARAWAVVVIEKERN